MTSDRDATETVLAALADPTRRDLLDVLAHDGGGTATSLAAALPVSRQAVVKHLGVLEDAGLVAGHRSGREVRYQLRPDPLQSTARWISELAADWDRRLQALKHLAENTDQP